MNDIIDKTVSTGGIESQSIIGDSMKDMHENFTATTTTEVSSPSELMKEYGHLQAIIAANRNKPHASFVEPIGHTEDFSMIVMENAKFGNLENYIGKEACGSNAFYSWAIDAFIGLVHAHEKSGLVHLDLKPANLLLTEDYDAPILCLLYTSDSADDSLLVYIGSRRIIKKK